MRTDWLAAVEDESPSGVEEIHPEQWGGPSTLLGVPVTLVELPPRVGFSKDAIAIVEEPVGRMPGDAGVWCRSLEVLAVQRRPVPWLWSRA
jgi:hypothetical protein